jgi:hypothetical protein
MRMRATRLKITDRGALEKPDSKEQRMAEALTTLTKLLIVREIQEDASGAALHFQDGGHARLTLSEADYTAHLRLARRSQERQHPVGVRFGEGQAVAELLRADNDVPTQFSEEGPDRGRVFFEGHDGVFHLQPDHPEFGRIRALLDEAIRRKGRVWFIAQKPDLALLDVMAAGI